MSFGVTQPSNTASTAIKASRDNYTTLSALYDDLAKPDYREQLVKQFGNQMISGVNSFLRFTGATKALGSANSVQWHEEDRLHFSDAPSASVDGTGGTNVITSGGTALATLTYAAAHRYIVNDIILMYHGTAGTTKPEKAMVTAVPTSTTITVYPLATWGATVADNGITLTTKIGNSFEAGTDMPTEGLASDAIARSNTYYTLKTMFSAPATDMTNESWIQAPNGSMMWIWKQEQDFRDRTEDYNELMMIASGVISNATLQGVSGFNQNGSESLFAAVEARGINVAGHITTIAELDTVIAALDKQAGVGEYAAFVNRAQDNYFNNLLSTGNATSLSSGVSEQYGTFDNSKDMAINLGFQSFSRSSYTFHKHDWKLLNDPTLLGNSLAGYYKYALIPMKNVIDPILGSKSPVLEINYKGDGKGYSRDMIHYITGAVPQAGYNSTKDAIQFNYTCEKALAVRGANNIVIGRGA